MDDIHEANSISISVNRSFLISFVEYGSTVLYKKWVVNERMKRDVPKQESVFRQAGFNYCIGSF